MIANNLQDLQVSRFVSDLVGNFEDRVSRDASHMTERKFPGLYSVEQGQYNLICF